MHVVFHINRKLMSNFLSLSKKKRNTQSTQVFRYSRTRKHFTIVNPASYVPSGIEIGEKKERREGKRWILLVSRCSRGGVIGVSRASLGNPGSRGSSRTADDMSGRVTGDRASEREKASGLLRAREERKIYRKDIREVGARIGGGESQRRAREIAPPLPLLSLSLPHYRIPPATSSFSASALYSRSDDAVFMVFQTSAIYSIVIVIWWRWWCPKVAVEWRWRW